MNKHIALIITSAIIGLAVFAICYWILQDSVRDARVTAVSVGMATLIFEYLRPYVFPRSPNGFFQTHFPKK